MNLRGDELKTNELFGKEVLDVGANKIGKVVDIEFDIHTRMISHMIVKAGLTKKYSVSLDKIDKIGDRLILNIEENRLTKN